MRRVFPQSQSPRQLPQACDLEADSTSAARLPLCTKRHRRRALLQIQAAVNHADKQQIIDSYLHQKIEPDASPEQNAAILNRKLQEMLPCLSPVDAEQLASRVHYFTQYTEPLTLQKQLLTDGTNLAAATAAAAESTADHAQSILIVQEYMLTAVRPEQGPVARLQALMHAYKQVEANLAFPTCSGWHEELEAFMHKQARLGCRNSPVYSQHVAKELNLCELGDVSTIADRYLYNRLVASWSPAANERRLVLELQVLLPQLCDVAVMQRVQARVDFFIDHMAQFCVQKASDQQQPCHSITPPKAGRNKSKHQWQLVMHQDDSEHYATVLVL